MARFIELKEFTRMLEHQMKYYGLDVLSANAVRLAERDSVRFRLIHNSEINIYDIEVQEDKFRYVFGEVLEPILHSIETSPYIASLKDSHASEVEALHQRIERLEKLNESLTEAFTNGEEFISGFLDERNSE